jgi:amino acid transporter
MTTPATPTRSMPESAPDQPPSGESLKRNALGVGGLTFLVVSAAAPLTVMAGIAPLAISIAGPGAPSAYLIAGAALIVFAVAFMGMTKYVAGSGGFYSYITLALGKHAGLGSAAVAWVSYNAVQIGLYGLFGIQAEALVKTVTGADLPWWLFAVLGLALVGLLGFLGIDVGAKVLGVLLVGETLILAILAVGVLAKGGATGLSLHSFAPSAVFTPGLGAVLGISFGAFLGFEATALYRREAKNPDRTIPRATYLAVGFMTLFYAFISWIAVQAFGNAAAQGEAAKNLSGYFFTAMDRYVGPWGSIVMNILIVTSIYAALLAFHNSINRYTFSLAKDGVLPAVFGRTHRRFSSPAAAGLLQTVLALIVVGIFAIAHADPYLQLLLWVNSPGIIGVIALQGLTGASVVVFFVRRRNIPRPRFLVPVAVLATLFMGGVIWLVLSNVELLTGASITVNIVIILITPAVFVIGMIGAEVLRRRKPKAYEAIGKGGESELMVADATGLMENPHGGS